MLRWTQSSVSSRTADTLAYIVIQQRDQGGLIACGGRPSSLIRRAAALTTFTT